MLEKLQQTMLMFEVKKCLIIKEWNSAWDKIGGGSKVDSAFHPSEVDTVSIYQEFLGT